MGCVIGSLASTVACCFGTAACHLCCACMPSVKNSTSTRLAYTGLLLLGTVVSIIMLAPGLRDELAKIPYLCDKTLIPDIPIPGMSNQVPGTILDSKVCDQVVGYQAVYRVCFGLACFFFLFAILMIRVNSSKDPRASIQNGFWFFKILILGGLMVGAFFIPYASNDGPSFAQVWMVIGMIGAFIFLLMQLILIIDFAYNWNKAWITNYEETQQRGWYCGLLSFTIFFYAASFTAVVLFYVYYARPGCTAHQAFVSVNFILCIAISILSILPRVQERLPYSGLLQSSFLTLYVMYTTWSAMTNNPDRYCNPNLFQHETTTNVTGVSDSTTTHLPQTGVQSGVDAPTIVGLIIFVLSVLFSCFRSSSQSTVGRLTLHGGGEQVISNDGGRMIEDGQQNGQQVYDNESEQTAYSYFFFHVLLMMGTMYIMMTLTNWYSPASDLRTLTTNEAAMWVKISSTWVVMALYIWTMVAPLIFPDRDFD